jgi:hypothetical protein
MGDFPTPRIQSPPTESEATKMQVANCTNHDPASLFINIEAFCSLVIEANNADGFAVMHGADSNSMCLKRAFSSYTTDLPL